MSIFATIYAMLDVSDVNAVVDDISPYVRGRGKDFPAVLYEVPTQTFERFSAGVYRTASEVQLSCLARSVVEAEAVAAVVLEKVVDNVCNTLDTIQRDYEEGYDDDSVGLFSVTINFTNFNGG